MNEQWTCAGCGIESPERRRSCDCPTSVVVLRGSEGTQTAWKIEEDTMEEIRGALARGYCTDENKGKELDSVLLEAQAVEIAKTIGVAIGETKR